MNGKIEQQGKVSTVGEGYLINFPITYTQNPFAIVSPNQNSSGALSATKFGYSISTTGIYVSSGGNVYWYSIGY